MSQIISIKKISDVLNYVDDKTLVLFDIDGTLIEPVQNIGGPAHFAFVSQKLLDKGFSKKEAIEKTYKAWVQLQNVITVKTVEPDTLETIEKLHDQNIKTLGLTGRCFETSNITFDQLNSVNISLHKNTIHDKELIFDKSVGFDKGVLHCGVTGDKGVGLLRFFERIDFMPEKMVFIDDLPHYLEEVQKISAEKNVEFTGIRYGAADGRYVTFDPARAVEEIKLAFDGKDQKDLKSLIDMVI